MEVSFRAAVSGGHFRCLVFHGTSKWRRVGRTAGGKADDDPHRSRRISLRFRDARHGRKRGELEAVEGVGEAGGGATFRLRVSYFAQYSSSN